MINESYDIFISYRRGSGEVMARLLYELLKNRGYHVFFDHKSLSSGEYEEKLLNIISECRDFIVVFSEDCFKTEANSGEFYMKEIRRALERERNIVPVMIEGYNDPSDCDIDGFSDPVTVRRVIGYNGKSLKIDGIDGTVDRLCKDFLRSEPRLTDAEVTEKCKKFNNMLLKHADIIPEPVKMSVVESAINALGDEYSAPILQSTFSHLSGGVFNLRTEYEYEIRINKDYDFKFIDIPSDKYYKLSERLDYTKIFRVDKLNSDESFWISFATGLGDLDDELRDEKFFFSENFMIDGDDMLKLRSLDSDGKRRFYKSVMNVQIGINRKRLEPEEIIIDDGGIFARYSMPEGLDEKFEVSIRFQIPQRYSNSFFFACISEPTYSPKICVEYDSDNFQVEMIPFLTRSLTRDDTSSFDGELELSIDNEWIMPISGAIFLINLIG